VGSLCDSRASHILLELVISGMTPRQFLPATISDLKVVIGMFVIRSPEEVELDSFSDVTSEGSTDQRRSKLLTNSRRRAHFRVLMSSDRDALKGVLVLLNSVKTGNLQQARNP
jgi:hypothetical protein